MNILFNCFQKKGNIVLCSSPRKRPRYFPQNDTLLTDPHNQIISIFNKMVYGENNFLQERKGLPSLSKLRIFIFLARKSIFFTKKYSIHFLVLYCSTWVSLKRNTVNIFLRRLQGQSEKLKKRQCSLKQKHDVM